MLRSLKPCFLHVLCISFLIPAFTVHAEEKEAHTLDSIFNDRIALNEKYRDEFAKEAESSPLAEDLVPMEKVPMMHGAVASNTSTLPKMPNSRSTLCEWISSVKSSALIILSSTPNPSSKR